MRKLDPRCPKCGAGIPKEVCQECGYVGDEDELARLKVKANKLRYRNHPDGQSGWTVVLGVSPIEEVIGTVWYSKMTRRWYASPNVSAQRPSESAGDFDTKHEAAECLRKLWPDTLKARTEKAELEDREEKVKGLRLELRHRIECLEITERAAMLMTFPSRWLSQPYNEAIARLVNLDFALFGYSTNLAISKTAMKKEVKKAMKEVKAHLKEGADRMSDWTGEERL